MAVLVQTGGLNQRSHGSMLAHRGFPSNSTRVAGGYKKGGGETTWIFRISIYRCQGELNWENGGSKVDASKHERFMPLYALLTLCALSSAYSAYRGRR